jgi:hypothetical protein
MLGGDGGFGRPTPGTSSECERLAPSDLTAASMLLKARKWRSSMPPPSSMGVKMLPPLRGGILLTPVSSRGGCRGLSTIPSVLGSIGAGG